MKQSSLYSDFPKGTTKTEKSKRTNEMELAYCKKCVQMTNHKDGVCLKCKSKRTKSMRKCGLTLQKLKI